jgi:hypothetical protein
VPNQYQILRLEPDGITRYARQYSLGQKRWIGDTRIDPDGSEWRVGTPWPGDRRPFAHRTDQKPDGHLVGNAVAGRAAPG